MKKILAIVLVLTFFLSGCGAPAVDPKVAYADVINDFKIIAEGILNESLDDVAIRREEFDKLGLSDTFCAQLENKTLSITFVQEVIRKMTNGLENPTLDSFGYILEDINGDEVPELFWVREDRVMLGIFTLVDGKAAAVGFYGPDRRGMLTEDGEIYCCVESAASSYNRSVLEKNSTELTITFAIVHDGFDSGKKVCYEYVDGERVSIDEDRYKQLKAENPFEASARWLALEIQPLA